MFSSLLSFYIRSYRIDDKCGQNTQFTNCFINEEFYGHCLSYISFERRLFFVFASRSFALCRQRDRKNESPRRPPKQSFMIVQARACNASNRRKRRAWKTWSENNKKNDIQNWKNQIEHYFSTTFCCFLASIVDAVSKNEMLTMRCVLVSSSFAYISSSSSMLLPSTIFYCFVSSWSQRRAVDADRRIWSKHSFSFCLISFRNNKETKRSE